MSQDKQPEVDGQQELPFDQDDREDRDFDADGPVDPEAEQAARAATEATTRKLGERQDGGR